MTDPNPYTSQIARRAFEHGREFERERLRRVLASPPRRRRKGEPYVSWRYQAIAEALEEGST